MRKFICILLLSFCLLSLAAAEETDLSGLSFDELAALRDRCQLEMMQRDTWQKVEVPQGVYKVGVHIPAGTWTITCETGYLSSIEFGDKLDATGQGIDWMADRNAYDAVYNPNSRSYKAGDRTEYTITLKLGDYVIIDHAPATFTPGASVPSFKFK